MFFLQQLRTRNRKEIAGLEPAGLLVDVLERKTRFALARLRCHITLPSEVAASVSSTGNYAVMPP